jgi:hypothetical protein
MNQNLLSLSHGDLYWTDSLPPAFKAVRLPGSTIATSIGEFGSICIQEFNDENFSIHFKVFDLLQHFVSRSFLQRPGFFAKLVVKGRIDISNNTPPSDTLTTESVYPFTGIKLSYTRSSMKTKLI